MEFILLFCVKHDHEKNATSFFVLIVFLSPINYQIAYVFVLNLY